MNRCAVGLLVGVGCMFRAMLAHAETETREVDSAALRARISHIQQLLDAEQPAARRWLSAWSGTYAGLAVVQSTSAVVIDDDGRRADLAIGATAGGVGLIGLLAAPFPAVDAGDQLRAVPSSSETELQRKADFAEALFRQTARGEAFRATAWPHFVAAAMTGTGALTLWLFFERPVSAATYFVVGMTLAEAQILTQPTGVLRAWQAEGRRMPIKRPLPFRKRTETSGARWLVTPFGPAGLSLSATF